MRERVSQRARQRVSQWLSRAGLIRPTAAAVTAAVMLIAAGTVCCYAQPVGLYAPEKEPEPLIPKYGCQYLKDDVEAQAELLNGIHLFSGTGSGFALERTMDRCEAAVMLVKFMGEQETALKGTWRHPFRDVPEWADPYVGWLYQQGITSGVSEDRYGASQPVTLWQYGTFLTKALHGTGEIDTGIVSKDEITHGGEGNLVRGDAVSLSCRALFCMYDREGGAGSAAQYLREKGCFTMAEFRAAGWDVIVGRPDLFGLTGNTMILHCDNEQMLLQAFDGAATDISLVKTSSLEKLDAYRVEDEQQRDADSTLTIKKNTWIAGIYNGGGGLYQLTSDGRLLQITAHAAWDAKQVKDGSWLIISGPERYPIQDPFTLGDRLYQLDTGGKLTELLRLENSPIEFTRDHTAQPGKESPAEAVYPLDITEHIRGYGMMNYDTAYYELREDGKLGVIDYLPGSAEAVAERGYEWVENRLREKGLKYEPAP